MVLWLSELYKTPLIRTGTVSMIFLSAKGESLLLDKRTVLDGLVASTWLSNFNSLDVTF